MAADGGTSSTRNGMIGRPFATALSTSLEPGGEVFALEEKTSTMMLLPLIAAMSASAYGRPGRTSRGAIQQRILLLSMVAQAAYATDLSRDE